MDLVLVLCQNVLNHFYATILTYKAHCSDERGGGQHSCLEGKQFKQFTTYFTVKERKEEIYFQTEEEWERFHFWRQAMHRYCAAATAAGCWTWILRACDPGFPL